MESDWIQPTEFECPRPGHDGARANLDQQVRNPALRVLALKPGMTLLDIGCGRGGLMRHASERHQVNCVELTISREQAAWAG